MNWGYLCNRSYTTRAMEDEMADLKELFTMAKELEKGANALIPLAKGDDMVALGQGLLAVSNGFAELNVEIEQAGVDPGKYPELMTALQRVNQVMEEIEEFYSAHPGNSSLH